MADASPFALHEAARLGNGIVSSQAFLLLELMYAPRQASAKDADGRLPIHWAVSANSTEIVRLLAELRDFDPDVEDDSGWSPLMIAVNVKDSEEVLSILLAKEADVNQQNHNGQTALHLVASKGNLDVARILFRQQPPASARVRDKRGQYAIHRAAAAGSTPMIALLLSHRSPIDATDSSGYTALHHAIAEGHGDAAVALLKAGADASKRDNDGMLAIDLAPDKEVRRFIQRQAEQEGIEI
ncbi:hypothetical protein SAPIO_CDS6823 [Scedosporium apiospermum]|uniref:Uncharacterized protein n=1 Tax=Pseudallescheria apiosperma TaxID=563466 RepID=A0A084G3B4_PSEDA|nr:uncharacterized protein SAPIO_CDS6823 [Scedosporium apiospermum]KEZ41826.1 hypothetical protein SAPIO_CDS6823 [Scedosporium apiospermum]